MKIKLKVACLVQTSIGRIDGAAGSVVEVTQDEAARLLALGAAEAAESSGPETATVAPPRTATKPPGRVRKRTETDNENAD
jgi:hypothetical protein